MAYSGWELIKMQAGTFFSFFYKQSHITRRSISKIKTFVCEDKTETSFSAKSKIAHTEI